MKSKTFKSDSEYQDAIELMERIGDDSNFENDEKMIRQFNLLLKLIKQYEEDNFALEIGDPIEIIKLKMNYLNLKAKDLVPLIGSKGLVSEVINKKRRLSKSMIRNLSEFLNIDQELLNIEYDIIQPPKAKKIHVEFELSDMLNQQASVFSNHVFARGLLFNICSPACI